jgi:hypothetical protein
MRSGLAELALAAALSLVLFVSAWSQNAPMTSGQPPAPGSGDDQSLGAIAHKARAQKSAHAKRVITDDDLQNGFAPLPRLKMNEAENGEDVVAAISQYKQAHSPEQTESIVRRWFDEYDQYLAKAIGNNAEIKATRGANVNNAYAICEDDHNYEECRKRKIAEVDGARYDEAQIARNNESIVRLQHSLMNIKNRMAQMGLHYEWFKVRTTNNIDRF